MLFTATIVAYFHTCKRKMYLHHHGIRMEHTSDVVYEGKLIGESTYPERAAKNTQLELDGIKIDYYDAKTNTVHETKKSDKMEQAHLAQVRYYLYVLHRNGIEGARGIIEYPTLRQRQQLEFDPEQDIPLIEGWLSDIEQILAQEECPPVINKSICKNCSYYDYCYVGDED
ncbi:CRISPR-associated protein Cas4 [Haliscomenobacter sp.]|uniref:CRISPR-associated protein Cas4 n=1 Tax=Haliscomenobacter sp. TaxID=2717303 RepID=UPI003593CD7A